MTQRTIVTFLNAVTSVSTSSSYAPDYRLEEGDSHRTLFGTLTSGAEVNLYFSLTDPITSATVRHLEKTFTAVSGFSSATNSFSESIVSPFTKIEIVKANASGTATVLGVM